MKILTVKKLIEHLQTNFKPEDKLCFWHEGGAYMNCEYALQSMLSDKMFIKIKDDKEKMKNRFNFTEDEIKEDYKNVTDNDVLIF
jgi:hypothetical protein